MFLLSYSSFRRGVRQYLEKMNMMDPSSKKILSLQKMLGQDVKTSCGATRLDAYFAPTFTHTNICRPLITGSHTPSHILKAEASF